MATKSTVTAQVSPAATPHALTPQTSISIAVDTAYVAAQQGKNISQGIYMTDNRLRNGSSGEGNLELRTVCNNGDLIGFNVLPINALGASGDSVVITGFNVSNGSVFTAAGTPRQQPPPAGELAGAYWIGQAMAQGNQTYQIQIMVTVGLLQPVTYFINWDPFITAR
jgi:ABC-type siderophore export system fused ATPase/permease subunit